MRNRSRSAVRPTLIMADITDCEGLRTTQGPLDVQEFSLYDANKVGCSHASENAARPHHRDHAGPGLCSGGELHECRRPTDAAGTDWPDSIFCGQLAYRRAGFNSRPRTRQPSNAFSRRSLYKRSIFGCRHDVKALRRGRIHQRLCHGLGSVAQPLFIELNGHQFARHVWTTRGAERVSVGSAHSVLRFSDGVLLLKWGSQDRMH